MEARAGQIIQRIQVLENVKRHGVILANVCPVQIYSGIGNTVTQINESRGIKFKGNSKQQIIKAAWASYRVELVKHYKPRCLVILGKGVHEAIGQDELESVMQGMGGKYLDYIKHPSWNGHCGDNIMPLLCKLWQMALPPPEVAPAAAQVTLPPVMDVHKPRQMKLPPLEVAMAAAEVNLPAVMDVYKLQQMALPPPEVAPAAKVNSPAATDVEKKKISTRTWTWITWTWMKTTASLCHLALMTSPKRKIKMNKSWRS